MGEVSQIRTFRDHTDLPGAGDMLFCGNFGGLDIYRHHEGNFITIRYGERPGEYVSLYSLDMLKKWVVPISRHRHLIKTRGMGDIILAAATLGNWLKRQY